MSMDHQLAFEGGDELSRPHGDELLSEPGLADVVEEVDRIETDALREIEEDLEQDPEVPSGLFENLAVVAASAEVTVDDTEKKDIFSLQRDPETYEVKVESTLTLENYKGITAEEDWNLLLAEASKLAGKEITFINPTMEGGGVAMLRPKLVHLLNLLGMKAHWVVMEPLKDPARNVFLFTKQMHNISQRREEPGERITPEGKALHQEWCDENAEVLERQPFVTEADVLVIDDPQPAPLIKRFRAANPDAKFVWRNHIDTDHDLMADPTTPQGEVAHYLMNECDVASVDAAITHPVDRFTHKELKDKTYYAPATTDPFDEMNRRLNPVEVAQGFEFLNSELAQKNAELIAAGRMEDVQTLIDPENMVIVGEWSRFDESKGKQYSMQLVVMARDIMRQELTAQGLPEDEIERRLPVLVCAGNGSIDDPSGAKEYERMLKIRREAFTPEQQKAIIVGRFSHNYYGPNALMHKAKVGLQTSEAEGCETRISDWIEHDVPVEVFNNGGMPSQVTEGKSGYILDYAKPGHDLERGAQLMAEMLLDPQKHAEMVESTRAAAHEFNSREYTTVANVVRFLGIFNDVLEGRSAPQEERHRWKLRDRVEALQKQLGSAPHIGSVATS